jgi:hypothetical protein
VFVSFAYPLFDGKSILFGKYNPWRTGVFNFGETYCEDVFLSIILVFGF